MPLPTRKHEATAKPLASPRARRVSSDGRLPPQAACSQTGARPEIGNTPGACHKGISGTGELHTGYPDQPWPPVRSATALGAGGQVGSGGHRAPAQLVADGQLRLVPAVVHEAFLNDGLITLDGDHRHPALVGGLRTWLERKTSVQVLLRLGHHHGQLRSGGELGQCRIVRVGSAGVRCEPSVPVADVALNQQPLLSTQTGTPRSRGGSRRDSRALGARRRRSGRPSG